MINAHQLEAQKSEEKRSPEGRHSTQIADIVLEAYGTESVQ
jgi:hypothetical protein